MPASEVRHKYEDKFALVESLGTLLISSIAYCLKELGVSDSDLSKMKGWVKERTVTLAFKSTETCSFAKKTEEMKESDTKHVTKSTVFGTSESKTVTKVREVFLVDPLVVGSPSSRPDHNVLLDGRHHLRTCCVPRHGGGQAHCAALSLCVLRDQVYDRV